MAHWQDPKKGPQRRPFLVEHHGEEEVRARAIHARETGVARSRAYLLARQREEASKRLAEAAPMPRPVKDPRSRLGISMAWRRPRVKRAR